MSKNYLISCASSFFTYIDAYVYILTLNRQILKPPVLGHSITVLSTRNNKWSSPPPLTHTHTWCTCLRGGPPPTKLYIQPRVFISARLHAEEATCETSRQTTNNTVLSTIYCSAMTAAIYTRWSKHDSYTILQHCSANNIVTTSLLISRSQVYSKQNNSFGVE